MRSGAPANHVHGITTLPARASRETVDTQDPVRNDIGHRLVGLVLYVYI